MTLMTYDLGNEIESMRCFGRVDLLRFQCEPDIQFSLVLHGVEGHHLVHILHIRKWDLLL